MFIGLKESIVKRLGWIINCESFDQEGLTLGLLEGLSLGIVSMHDSKFISYQEYIELNNIINLVIDGYIGRLDRE